MVSFFSPRLSASHSASRKQGVRHASFETPRRWRPSRSRPCRVQKQTCHRPPVVMPCITLLCSSSFEPPWSSTPPGESLRRCRTGRFQIEVPGMYDWSASDCFCRCAASKRRRASSARWRLRSSSRNCWATASWCWCQRLMPPSTKNHAAASETHARRQRSQAVLKQRQPVPKCLSGKATGDDQQRQPGGVTSRFMGVWLFWG